MFHFLCVVNSTKLIKKLKYKSILDTCLFKAVEKIIRWITNPAQRRKQDTNALQMRPSGAQAKAKADLK